MDATTARWLIGVGVSAILILIGFIVKRLFSELDRHRDKLHDHQNEILKLNGALSILKELIQEIKPRRNRD